MSQDFVVVRHPDAGGFLRRAGTWLLRSEAEHNLVLGVADGLALGNRAGHRDPVYLATVERDGQVVGCAFRTPPSPLGVTRLPRASLPTLCEDVAAVYPTLPGVLGPDATAAAVAETWSRSAGVRPGLHMCQTLYSLRSLVEPEPWPEGRLRAATWTGDRDRVLEWMEAFFREVRMDASGVRARARSLVAGGDLFFWEDGAPRTMAGVSARTPHGARIGYVFTPPDERGRGYGSTVTAALTNHLLRRGARFCFLYADRANPTSNGIYLRLGYRPVCEVSEYRMVGPAAA